MRIRALVKKIVPIVDNLTTTEEKRLQQIKQMPKLQLFTADRYAV